MQDRPGDPLKDMGLCLLQGRMYWTFVNRDGYLRWLPFRVRQAILRVWNWEACSLMGHEPYGDTRCVHCNAKSSTW